MLSAVGAKRMRSTVGRRGMSDARGPGRRKTCQKTLRVRRENGEAGGHSAGFSILAGLRPSRIIFCLPGLFGSETLSGIHRSSLGTDVVHTRTQSSNK